MALRAFRLETLLLAIFAWTLSGAWLKSGFRSNNLKMPCGSVDYDPRSQCCCRDRRSTVTDIPEKDCQCCGDKGYWWGDTNMPSSCRTRCGDELFHKGTQMCCAWTVVNVTSAPGRSFVCCGTAVIDEDTHTCCGLNPASEVPIKRRGPYGCCRKAVPFHKASTRCNRSSGTVGFRGRQTFSPQELCKMTLPAMLANNSLPVPPKSHKHIRGFPQFCQITADREQVVVALSPFIIKGQELPPECRRSDTLYLTMKHGYEDCASMEELQMYFHGKVVDVFVKKRVVCNNGKLELRLKAGNNAVVYLSAQTQSILEKSLH